MKTELLLCLSYVRVVCRIMFVHKCRCHTAAPLSLWYSLKKGEQSYKMCKHLLNNLPTFVGDLTSHYHAPAVTSCADGLATNSLVQCTDVGQAQVQWWQSLWYGLHRDMLCSVVGYESSSLQWSAKVVYSVCYGVLCHAIHLTQATCKASAQLESASSFANCHLSCNLSGQSWYVSLAAVCRLSLSGQLQHGSSAAMCLLSSAQLPSEGSIATRQVSCQVRCSLSAQLHSVGRLDPLPSLNSMLPPKLWAVFLVATNQSRVHAVTVQCMAHPVQATTCVPTLSNTMILQCVYRRHDWTAVTSYETQQFRSCPIGPGRISVIMNGYKNSWLGQ